MNPIDRAEMGFLAGLGGSGDAEGAARYPALRKRLAAQGGHGDPFARAAHAFVTPAESTETTHEAEATLRGWGLPFRDFVSPPPGWKSTNRKPYDPGAFARAAQLGEDMGLETASDITNYVPVLGTFSLLRNAGRVGRAGARLAGKPLGAAVNAAGKGLDATAAAAHPIGQAVQALRKKPPAAFLPPSPRVRFAVNRAGNAAARAKDRLLTSVVEGHDLRKGTLRSGEDITKGHEGAGREARKREEEAYGTLIDAHRDELNKLGRERANLEERLAATKMTADQRARFPASYVQEQDALRMALSKKLGEFGGRLPPSIRTALLRRAYIEGTPEVRRKAMKAGYEPTREESLAPALNILHNFEHEYEPTQKLFDKLTKAEKSVTEGPVRYLTQGNKKASFDLPKMGGEPQTELADRLLDRLTRGARLAEYHGTRRKILNDLGLEPSREAGIARAEERAEGLSSQGDFAKAARYYALAERQRAAQATAAAKRAQHLRPDTPMNLLQHGITSGEGRHAGSGPEFLDPITANERALRQAKYAGLNTEGINARTSRESLAEKIGQHKGDKRVVAVAEKVARITRRGAEGTARGIGDVANKYQGNLNRVVGKIKAAATQQSGRVSQLGATLENHDLVRLGLRSHLPGLQESAKDLQAAYVAAKHLAGTAYKSGYGKDVDEWAHHIASERLDKPAGTSLSVVEREGQAPLIKGGQTMGATVYAKADIAKIAALIRKSGKKGKGATDADAIRVLDEAHNAIGQARETVDNVARSYDINKAGQSPENLANSMREMRDQFVKTHADVRADLARKPAVAGAIRRAISAVRKGDKTLQGEIDKAAKPQDVSLKRALAPSQKAMEQSHDVAGKAVAKVIGARARLMQFERQNAAVKAMNVDAKAAMEARNAVEIPESLQRRLFDDVPFYNKSMAAAFSDLQRDALFVLPYAHRKNITILAGLGPNGPAVIKRGIQIAREMRADKTGAAHAAAIQELENMGAAMNFAKEGERGYEKIPIIGKPIGRAVDAMSTAALDRYDTAMRLALMEHLKSKGVTGFQAGGQIRDVLGDYHNQAPLITELGRRAGANFPSWGLGIVPRAMTKAIREQPRAVQAYARSQRLISDDVTQPWLHADFDMGGPVEDAVKGAVEPWRYLASRSRAGLLADLFGFGSAAYKGEAGPFLGQEALSAVPGGSVLGALGNFPYPSNAPGPTRAAAALFGSYFPNKPTITQREAALRTLGMPAAGKIPRTPGMGKFKHPAAHRYSPEVRSQLEWEGYFNQPATFPRMRPASSPSP